MAEQRSLEVITQAEQIAAAAAAAVAAAAASQRQEHAPPADDMASPFGALESPFGAMDTPFGAAMESPFGAAVSTSPPSPLGPAAQPPESAQPAAAAPVEPAEDEDAGVDEGIALPVLRQTFSFGARKLRTQRSTHSDEEAMIEAALDAELGAAAGAEPAGSGPADALSELRPMPRAELPQRQHSLASLGQFTGVSTIFDLAAAAPVAAAAAAEEDGGPFAAAQRQPSFGSRLPSVRGSGQSGSGRQSGAAALEALAGLQAQQGQQPAGRGWSFSGQALTATASPFDVQLAVAQQQQLAAGASPFLGAQQPVGLRRRPPPPHQPQRHLGSSSRVNLEVGPAHLEVDERTGQASVQD